MLRRGNRRRRKIETASTEPQKAVGDLVGRNTSVKGVAVHVFNISFATPVVEAKG